jgi:hypothetical protein
MTESELLDVLDRQIDAHGLNYLLDMIVVICRERAARWASTVGERDDSDWSQAANAIEDLPIMPLGGFHPVTNKRADT